MMIKKYVQVYTLLFFCLLTFGLSGCFFARKGTDEKGKQEKETEQGVVNLYYLNTDEDGFTTVPYELKNQDDPLLASYEVTYKLSNTESHYTNQYKPAIFDGVVVNSIVLEDGEETVDMGVGYRQLGTAKEILLRTAVVKTLIQIDGVDSVRFTINGDSLLGSDDVPIGLMDKNTFILEDNEDSLYGGEEKVTLYYSNQDGDGLVEYNTVLKSEDNMPMETKVLLSLMDVPEDLDAICPLPSGLKINQTQVRNNVCYVDLSKDIENVLPGVEEKVMIYSMVNSITSLGDASSVQFTVEGKRMESLRNFDSFHLLLTNDYSLSDSEEKDDNGKTE